VNLKDTYDFYGINKELPARLKKVSNGVSIRYYSHNLKKQTTRLFKLRKGFGNKGILEDALKFAWASYLVTDDPESTTGYKGIELKEHEGKFYITYRRNMNGNYRRRCIEVDETNYKKALEYAVNNKAKDKKIPIHIIVDTTKITETMNKLLHKDK